MNAPRLAPLLFPLLLAGCKPDDAAREPRREVQPWFEECALARGLDFTHASGHAEAHWMPEIMGGGGALLDADGDGDLDAYLVQGGRLAPGAEARRSDALLENTGAGHFRAASAPVLGGYGMGAAAGDADEDGDTDLYVTSVGPNALLENRGKLSFVDVGARSGTAHPGWGTSAGFFDAEHDGDLDLFVVNYLEWSFEGELPCLNSLSMPDYCSPKNYRTPARSLLYVNHGNARFEDASAASGVDGRRGNGLGLAFGDVDANGWLDVFVANDGTANHLWKNQGELRFVESAMLAGCGVDSSGQEKAGMGVVLADLDHDLDLDLFVCNLAGESDSLFLNEGGFFVDRTAVSGLGPVSRPFTRFGVGALDFDQDGALDLFEATGRVQSSTRLGAAAPYAEENLLFRGLSPGLFTELPLRGGVLEPLVATSRAAAFGDVDGDGAPDVLVVNRDGPAHLLRNLAGGGHHWVRFRVCERSGRDALGASLELRVAGVARRYEVASASSYLAASDPRVHVGLGEQAGIERVCVRWVDGARESFGPFPAGAEHSLVRGQGAPAD
jgi:enediyne biosynthesis protein E4